MSPSPDLSPQSASSEHPSLEPSTPATPDSPSPVDSLESTESEDKAAASDESANTPVLRKPPMRPVRPQPPDQTAVKSTTTPSSSKPEIVPKPEIVSVHPANSTADASIPTEEEQAIQAALRQQPIPPPSEPKQYRAIGLVRGLYTKSEEEFTRGELQTSDGVLKSVLLGRVMSLVKNHIDLEKEHLWVVYPRTREEEKELHLQIVGVWEPETLKKDSDSEETSEPEIGFIDPRLQDDYFSVRGEIVFSAPDEKLIVVKIQQTPRKNSQKAKAFKLALQGELDNSRTVGYFWDLHVTRQDNTLVITDGTCVGLAPPKKRSKDFVSTGRPRKPAFGRGGGSRSPVGKPRLGTGTGPRPPRDPAAKPIKRTEQNPTSDA